MTSEVTEVLRLFFFFSSRRRHTRSDRDWSSDVCSSDLRAVIVEGQKSVLAFGARRPEARDVFWDGARLAKAWEAGRVWVVSVRPPEASVVARLPGARLVFASGGRWLWVNEPP